MASVTATVLNGAGLARGQRAELWLDDLVWHKRMFRQSRFRWTGEHAMDIVTRATGGALDYTTIGHLRWLQRRQDEVRDRGTQCRSAMADPLREAHQILGWDRTAVAVGLTVVDCRLTLAFAAGTTQADRTNIDVKGALRQLPFVNPLIQVWELKQLWRLYDAAHEMLTRYEWRGHFLTRQVLEDLDLRYAVNTAFKTWQEGWEGNLASFHAQRQREHVLESVTEYNDEELFEAVVEFLKAHPEGEYTYNQVAKALRLAPGRESALCAFRVLERGRSRPRYPTPACGSLSTRTRRRLPRSARRLRSCTPSPCCHATRCPTAFS